MHACMHRGCLKSLLLACIRDWADTVPLSPEASLNSQASSICVDWGGGGWVEGGREGRRRERCNGDNSKMVWNSE